MSKMDNLRAMREARYEQSMARSTSGAASTGSRPKAAAKGTQTKTTQTETAQTKRAPAKTAAENADATGPAAEQLCGHRSMNGRSCTRELGHAAKNHRYS